MTEEEKLPYEKIAAKAQVEYWEKSAEFFAKYQHLYTEEDMPSVGHSSLPY